MIRKGIMLDLYVRIWISNRYVINLQGRITDYHDNLIRTYNFVEPENKQPTIIAFKSDTSPDQLISAVKELLLLGNYGRMSGFPLLRAGYGSIHDQRTI